MKCEYERMANWTVRGITLSTQNCAQAGSQGPRPLHTWILTSRRDWFGPFGSVTVNGPCDRLKKQGFISDGAWFYSFLRVLRHDFCQCSIVSTWNERFVFKIVLLRHPYRDPPRSLVRDERTHPHSPRFVVYHSTCRPLSSSPPREQLCNRSCSNKHTHTCPNSESRKMRH